MKDSSGAPVKTGPNIKDWINPILIGSFILLFSFFFLRDIQEIPFHPDEATQIFMSSDVDLFIQDPGSLIWKPQNPMDIRMQYRLLDAPFSRTWIGIFRALGRVPELPNDWNWSADWGQNINASAYPTEAQLITGRLASAIFLPLDILFLYLIGRKLRGNLLGWLMVSSFQSKCAGPPSHPQGYVGRTNAIFYHPFHMGLPAESPFPVFIGYTRGVGFQYEIFSPSAFHSRVVCLDLPELSTENG